MIVALLALSFQGCPTMHRGNIPPKTGPNALPLFPEKPPTPTTYAPVPDDYGLMAGTAPTFGEIATRLENALTQAGYSEKAYYGFPGGFALACRMEQLDGNWVPLPPPDRWAQHSVRLRRFSIQEYLANLFLAPAGRYRLLVFIVTDRPFLFEPRPATAEEGKAWIFGGATGLPPEMAAAPVPAGSRCFVLVYEFKKDDAGKPAVLDAEATIGALDQLQRTGLWQ